MYDTSVFRYNEFNRKRQKGHSMTKQDLAARIWATANKLRKNIKASEYKDYILGFMFYKYLCDKELDTLHDAGGELEDIKDASDDVVALFRDKLGYFIRYTDLFIVWKETGVSLGAKDVVEAIERFYLNLDDERRKVFNGIFSALESGLNKLGSDAGSRDKAVRDIIDLIDLIPPTSRDFDVLGYIYEYLIQQFSSEAKKDGAFYTPHELTSLMARIAAYRMKNRNEIIVYDPTVGTAGLLLNIGHEAGKYIDPDNIRYFGQELISETSNLAKMNLFMQNVPVQNICMRNADTLEEDWPFIDEQNVYSYLPVDVVVSNPPYSQHWSPTKHKNDPRYAGYGLAPEAKADYAFLLHCLYHLKDDGVMAIVLPHGVLFRGDVEGEIRKNLVLKHNIETIIGFPSQLFFATSIPVIVMVLSKNRTSDDILFIDASESFKKGKKQNTLQQKDVQRIFDAVVRREDIPHFAHLASIEEIEANDYNLNISRYVSAKASEAPYDLYSVMSGMVSDAEVDGMDEIWKTFPSLRSKLLTPARPGYSSFADIDVKETVYADKDVKEFLFSYGDITNGFGRFIDKSLIDEKGSRSAYDGLAEKLFNDFSDIPLVDVYEVFQHFYDGWIPVETDLIRLSSEGWGICKEAEQIIVSKKNPKTKEIKEVPEGWEGKIIPLNLIKRAFLQDDFRKMEELTAEADAKAAEYGGIWDGLDPEEKADLSKDDNEETFDDKTLKVALKEKSLDDETVKLLKEMLSLISKEKALRSAARKIEKELDEKAIEKLKVLTDDEISRFLHEKWTISLMNRITRVADDILSGFVKDFKSLRDKYAYPMEDLSKEIEDATAEMKKELSELVGDEADMEAIRMILEEL